VGEQQAQMAVQSVVVDARIILIRDQVLIRL